MLLLGIIVLFSLLIFRDIVEEVVGEGCWLSISVKTAAADLAHDSGEEARSFLDDEANNEDANTSGVKHSVHLIESI